MPTIVVFKNHYERAAHCADYGHDFENQPAIFCSETNKFLSLCEELFHNRIYAHDNEKEAELLKKIYGIAKTYHSCVVWYGKGNVSEPDRFLIKRGGKDIAFIQC